MWDAAHQGLNQLASASASAAEGEDLALPGRAVPPACHAATNNARSPSRASPDALDDFRDEPSHSPSSSRGAGLPHGRARSNRGRKSNAAGGPDTYAQRHQAAEARRRNRINGRIEALRKLVPNDPRSNTATFLEDVIKYILSLQDSNEKLEAVFQAFTQQQQQQQPQQPSQQAQALQAQLPQLSQKPQPRPKEEQQQHQPQQPEPQHSSHSNQSQQNSDSFPQLLPPNHLNGLHLPAASSSTASCIPPPLQLPACVPLEAQLQGALPLQALMLLQQQQQHQQTHAQQLQQLQLQLQGVNQQHAHQTLLHQHHQQQQQQQQQHLAGAISAELLNSSTPILAHSGNLPPSFPSTPFGHSLLPIPPAQLPHQPAQLLHLSSQLAAPPPTLASLGQLQFASTLLPHSANLPQQLAGLGVGAAGPSVVGGSSALAATTQLLGTQGGPSTIPTLAPSASSIPSTPALGVGGERQATLLAPQDLPARPTQ